MTRKNRIISIAIIAVLTFVVLCASGVTLALNVIRNSSTGSITTADLNLSATAKNVAVYTAVAANDADTDTFADGDGNLYKHQQCNVQSSDGTILFGNRQGGVLLTEDSVTIDNVMPGDKVEFDIEVTSESNIAFNYRAELFVDATKGQTLLNQLSFSAGQLGLLRKDVSEDNGLADETLSQAVLTDYTEWTKISASKSQIETIRVSVELPITATEGQGETVRLYYVVRGEQNTESQDDIASVVSPTGEVVRFKKLYTNDPENLGAVNYALKNGIDTVSVIGNNIVEEGEVRINRAVNFVGVADELGNYPTLNGARIVVENGATASFKNVNFDGASYIDVSGAMGLTLDNCKAEVSPVKLYDEAKRDFVENAAFVVSATSLTPVKLNVINSRISSQHGSAISLRSPLSSGSVISNNVFGTSESGYDGTAVMVFNGADNLDVPSERPVITVSQNTLYGDTAFGLGSSAGANEYLIVSRGNAAYGIKDNLFANGFKYNGKALAAFVDNGSTIDGAGLSCADIAYKSLVLGGVNVSLNSFNLIAAGTVALSESNISVLDFYDRYTIGGELNENDIVFYSDGN